MEREELKTFYLWFNSYVKRFYSKDPYVHKNILLKEEHTYRVCENIVFIAKSLNLSQSEQDLAETIALFHDIGRFEQFRKYKTYSDDKSENHSEIGLRILDEEDVLSDLEEDEHAIILKAIQYHNSYELPMDETSEVLVFSKLIRDADKLDIFDILVNHYEQHNLNSNRALDNFPNGDECSPWVVKKIINHERIRYNEVSTLNDMKLLRLSWVYDINFGLTLKLINEKEYIHRILRQLPKNEEINRIRETLYNFLALEK